MAQKELFRSADLPVFQNKTYSTSEAARACPRGDIVLVQDESTGLIHNAVFDPARMVYDGEYQNEQACSSVFQRHMEDVTAIVDRHFAGFSLLEIGCGKGYFLEHLRARGYAVRGIDPAYEGMSLHVIKARFEPSLGMRADGLILRHVLEHVADPVAFLEAMAAANGGTGRVYIEVPCMEWICRRRAWFDIFYEHVNYFRAGDFSRLFSCIYESGHLFGGQYLYVVADLASLRRPIATGADRLAFPADFLGGLSYEETRRKQRAESGVPAALWGAASKGVIFSVYLQRRGVELTLAVDINPAKQGRFLPVTGLPVMTPKEALDTLPPGADLFVTNSNYLDEIIAQSGNRFHYLTVDQHEF